MGATLVGRSRIWGTVPDFFGGQKTGFTMAAMKTFKVSNSKLKDAPNGDREIVVCICRIGPSLAARS